MFTARTRKPLSDLIAIIERTVSYRIVLPTFLLDSVFVATWARMSVIASEASGSFLPKTRSSFSIFTFKIHDYKLKPHKNTLCWLLPVKTDLKRRKRRVLENNRPELNSLIF